MFVRWQSAAEKHFQGTVVRTEDSDLNLTIHVRWEILTSRCHGREDMPSATSAEFT